MRPRAFAWLVPAALVAFGATASSSAAKAPRQIVIYSQTTAQEFNNHSDDRARGDQNNPFGVTTSIARAGGLIGHGPFPGDRTVFVFKLFSNAGLTSSIGSATFSCQYGFAKHGMCQAQYVLGGGTLLGLGFIDFNAKTFALAVTGGTGRFQDARGDVLVTPDAKKRGNKVAFTLV